MLDLRARQRLGRLLGMIGSAHDPEALTAARKADEMVRRSGMTWEQALALPTEAEPRPVDVLEDWPTHWPEAVELCLEHQGRLNEASQAFVTQLAVTMRTPSQKQAAWLRKCVLHIQGEK